MLRTCMMTAAAIVWGVSASAESHATDASKAESATAATMAQEVDLEAAAKIFSKSCRACHGNKAQGASSYPSLSDKEPDYVAEMLGRYRSGEKIGPNSILMIQHAKKLSDEDIASLAVYVTTAFD